MIIAALGFTVWHLLGFLFLHCLPGICAAALMVFKGYHEARGIVRTAFLVFFVFASGIGGLLVALLLPEWPAAAKRVLPRDLMGEGW